MPSRESHANWTHHTIARVAIACEGKKLEHEPGEIVAPSEPATEIDPLDIDDDGWLSENDGDCNDDDATFNPDADETCDLLEQLRWRNRQQPHRWSCLLYRYR